MRSSPTSRLETWVSRAAGVAAGAEPSSKFRERATADAAPGPFFQRDAIARARRSAKFSPEAAPWGSGIDATSIRAEPAEPILGSGTSFTPSQLPLRLVESASPLVNASIAFLGSPVHLNVKTLLRPSFSPIGKIAGAVAAEPAPALGPRLLLLSPIPPRLSCT